MTVSQSAPQTDRQDKDVIVELEDTSVSFGMNRGRSKVLNEVDFEVYRDEIVGVIGESGSGKSMFASAMLDAVPEPGLTTGNVTYYPKRVNRSPSRISRKRRFASSAGRRSRWSSRGR